jgi:hypothetical protein
MLNSARWGVLRPPGTNLPWYYSPNGLGTSSFLRSPDLSTSEHRERFSTEESDKSMSITTAGVNQRISRFVSSAAPAVETTPLRPLFSTTARPGTAPRLRFDDLRTGERVDNHSNTQSNFGKSASTGKKSAFVAAMQVT